MRRFITLVVAAVFALAGTGTALAGHENKKGPGPNGHNNHGLCTAYFNGQKNGHAGRNPGPFAALVARAEDEAAENNDDDPDNDVTGPEAVHSWCTDANNNPKDIGGQPSHGRYPELFE